MATKTEAFEPEGIIKRTKGKMVMLYAVVDGEEVHMASFFHENKALYVLNAITEMDPDLDITDEDAPKKRAKKSTSKKPAAKKATAKKRKK